MERRLHCNPAGQLGVPCSQRICKSITGAACAGSVPLTCTPTHHTHTNYAHTQRYANSVSSTISAVLFTEINATAFRRSNTMPLPHPCLHLVARLYACALAPDTEGLASSLITDQQCLEEEESPRPADPRPGVLQKLASGFWQRRRRRLSGDKVASGQAYIL